VQEHLFNLEAQKQRGGSSMIALLMQASNLGSITSLVFFKVLIDLEMEDM